MRKIAIIGVGFMGGSFAKAIKMSFSTVCVWGYARSNTSYYKLKRLRILDKVEKNLEKLLKDADYVVLATPVYAIVEYLKKISCYLKKGTIVFDLGSSKELVEKSAKRFLPKEVDFVGCHPLCGSEKSGPQHSVSGLFKGSLCIITSSFKKKSTREVKKMWEKMGCRIVFMPAKLHDRILSSTSHLPHLVSFSLMYLVSFSFRNFSSNSLRDLTRISFSPATVWTDIFLSNQKNVVRDVEKFIRVLNKFKNFIKNKKRKKIFRLIEEINAKQKKFWKKR